MSFYGKLIKKKKKIQSLFSLKKCLAVITKEQFIYTTLCSKSLGEKYQFIMSIVITQMCPGF